MKAPAEIRQIATAIRDAATQKTEGQSFLFQGRSMEPLFKEGDRIGVKKTGLRNLVCGDIIVYKRGVHHVVHRFLCMRNGEHGAKLLETKGDNLPAKDPPFLPDILVGRVAALRRDGKMRWNFERPRWRFFFFILGHLSLWENTVFDGVLRLCEWFKNRPVSNSGRRKLATCIKFPKQCFVKLILFFIGR